MDVGRPVTSITEIESNNKVQRESLYKPKTRTGKTSLQTTKSATEEKTLDEADVRNVRSRWEEAHRPRFKAFRQLSSLVMKLSIVGSSAVKKPMPT